MGRAFGTIGARRGDTVVEVTTYRADAYDGQTRKPVVAFGDSLEDDLVRRDFTGQRHGPAPARPRLRRPVGRPGRPRGRPPAHADDPGGLLRRRPAADDARGPLRRPARARPRARGLRGDARRWPARIAIVSAERVRDELVKLVLAPHPRAGLELLVRERPRGARPARAAGPAARGRRAPPPQGRLRALDDGARAGDRPRGPRRRPAESVPGPDLVLRLAALLHDIGKPRDPALRGRRRRLLPPPRGRRRQAREPGGCRALRFDKETTKAVARLVELHLRFHGYGDGQWTDSAVRRYVIDAGDLLPRLHRLTRADCTTRNVRKAKRLAATYDDLERRIEGCSRRRRSSRRCAPSSTATRSRPSSASARGRCWGGPTSTCWRSARPRDRSARRPRGGCASGGPTSRSREPESAPALDLTTLSGSPTLYPDSLRTLLEARPCARTPSPTDESPPAMPMYVTLPRNHHVLDTRVPYRRALNVMDRKETAVQRQLRRGGLASYEPMTQATLLALVEVASTPCTFLDVGAHMGLYSAMVKSVYGADVRVRAFEPTPNTAELARRLARVNDLDYEVVELALSSAPGEALLYISEKAETSNSLQAGFRESTEQVRVTVSTLDDYCLEQRGHAERDEGRRRDLRAARAARRGAHPGAPPAAHRLRDAPAVRPGDDRLGPAPARERGATACTGRPTVGGSAPPWTPTGPTSARSSGTGCWPPASSRRSWPRPSSRLAGGHRRLR